MKKVNDNFDEVVQRSAAGDKWRFKVLFDGECPFCVAEMRWLASLNRNGLLALEDIAAADFDPAKYGVTLESLMGNIHGVYPDGSLTVGMQTFRETYRAVGLGWLLAPTGWPILRPLFDIFYGLFARNRVRMGRLFGRNCATDRCALPPAKPAK